MAQNVKQLKQNELLFKEGDTSESMFIVKKGKLSVFKVKGSAEVELAEVGAGAMIGEMAFFDRKPRSASVKARLDSEIIELPFKALQAQYDTYPDWLKAIVKTINEHLRDANKRIKNLEQAEPAGKGKTNNISPYQANKLCSIIMFVANKWGAPGPEGIDIRPSQLRKFTIQIFQEPTNKMQTLMAILSSLGIMKQEDLGEGRQKITLIQPEVLEGYVEWANEYLFTEESKKITVTRDELKTLRALVHFAKKLAPDDKGQTKINLNDLQNESMKELGYLVGPNDSNGLIEKKIVSDKISEKGATLIKVDAKSIEKVYPFWQIFYAIEG